MGLSHLRAQLEQLELLRVCRCPAEGSARTLSMFANTYACAPLRFTVVISTPLCRNVSFQVHGSNSLKSVCSTSKWAVVHTTVYTDMFYVSE